MLNLTRLIFKKSIRIVIKQGNVSNNYEDIYTSERCIRSRSSDTPARPHRRAIQGVNNAEPCTLPKSDLVLMYVIIVYTLFI